MGTALLFERDAVEEVGDWEDGLPSLGRSSVLWIDLEQPDRSELERLADALELDPEVVRTLEDQGRAAPCLEDHGNYVRVTALAPRDDRRLTRVTCLVSERWVVSVRDGPIEMVDTFRERAAGSGATGELEGIEFLANLLEWVLESYFDAFEQIDVELEEIDAHAMAGDVESREEVLGRLVELRRDIGTLRRALTSHREAILALGRPELEAIASSRSAERFGSLRERLEEAAQAARDSRESVVGSFDVLIASTSQRTNDIVKVLTLASVLILPGTLLAGIMGMNFEVGLFDHAIVFWIVIAVILATAVVTLALARVRDWI